jgi:hypothetical protein
VGHWIIPATVVGVALVLQANLLRWLGPPGHLNALDVAKMNWPTLVSLLWASIGAGLTIWGRRVGSRVQWSAGAAFLVGAAIKLLLLDFGSLGQLANILAVIAAGGVFMLVGWLAPMPPARPEPPAPPPPPTPARATMQHHRAPDHAAAKVKDDDMSGKFAWTVTIAALVLITYSQCHGRVDADSVRSRISIGEAPAVPGSPEPQSQSASSGLPTDSCEQWREQVKALGDFQVHIVDAGATASSNYGAALNQTVVVEREGPAVLVLVAKGPTNWNIRRRAGADIRGVWLFIDTPQDIDGLKAHVPVLTPQWTRDDGCARPRNPEPVLLVEQTLAEVLEVSSVQLRVSSEGATARIVDDEMGAKPKQHWRRVMDDNPEQSTATMAP